MPAFCYKTKESKMSPSPDHYVVLGVPKNASFQEIKDQYKKLLKENHPDQYKGLRAKYETEGDETLLKVIDEKIRMAEEACKLINEAYEVLSDPVKRKAYDEQVSTSEVKAPEIVIHPKRITFGTLTEGQKKSSSFTIENKGGPASAVHIDWEAKPDWGELVIEPDPDNTFPIKVAVVVDTRGIPSGRRKEKVVIDIDGSSFEVEVSLEVEAIPASPQPIHTVTKVMSPGGTTHGGTSSLLPLAGLLVGGILFFCGLVTIPPALKEAEHQRQRQQILEDFPVKITEARRMKCLDYDWGSKEQNDLARKRLDEQGVVCVIFSVRNEGIRDIGKYDAGKYYASISMESPGLNTRLYSVWVDPGAGFPCNMYVGGDKLSPGETKTYECFENENTVVSTLCLGVQLGDVYLDNNYVYDLQKTVCSSVDNLVR